MDPKVLQDEKNSFAASQKIEPCTNTSCKFSGCICGPSCGCGKPDKIASGELQSCDPCAEFKRKKEAESGGIRS